MEGNEHIGKENDMTTVIFAEKPSQARAYADAFTVQSKTKTDITLAPCATFPNGAVITWGIGHLVELEEPKAYDKKWTRWTIDSLPIAPETFRFKIAKGKYKQFQAVKKWFRQADVLINACDVDREGSNIFYSIYHMTGVGRKPIRRLWINSLEVDEIRKGFEHLRDNTHDLRLYEEAKTRQVSDWLVGMNASRLYTILLKAKGFDDVFPIGRVQSPPVYLVYERTKAIEQSVSEPFFEIKSTFEAANGTYEGIVKGRMKERFEALALLEKHQIERPDEGVIQSIDTKGKMKRPPLLHSLSTLQATANRKWKMSPTLVLQTAQSLYEKKYISYPRTDTRVITKAELAYLVERLPAYQQLIDVSFEPETTHPGTRYVNDKGVQEHYAIIPTKQLPRASTIERMKREERLIYEEIIRTTLAMFHRPYRYDETNVITDVKGLAFHSKGTVERDKGWQQLFPKKKQNDDSALPSLTMNERVAADIAIHEGKTSPPKPYTEGQLITLMKTCGSLIEDEEETALLKEIEGIGTEATRSNIIETIKRHDYIRVQKNIVSLTKKGRLLCEALEGTLLASPSMTAKWEKYLHKIGNGDGESEKFLQSMYKFLNHLIETVPATIEQRTFQTEAYEAPKKTYGKKNWTPPKPIATCPRCKEGSIVRRKGFYGCTHYKKGCRQTFPDEFAKRKLTQTMIRDLCERGKTDVIDGFTSQQGKTFQATLMLVQGKLQFDFSYNA